MGGKPLRLQFEQGRGSCSVPTEENPLHLTFQVREGVEVVDGRETSPLAI